MARIALDHVEKVYGGGVKALDDLNLEVKEGEFVAVTGPSGSGKTTFLTIAGLLEELSSGEYWLDGVDARGLSDYRRSRLRN